MLGALVLLAEGYGIGNGLGYLIGLLTRRVDAEG